MEFEFENLIREAFQEYLAQMNDLELEPVGEPLPYNFDDIDSRQWRGIAREMVWSELQETTNRLNHWKISLARWHAWNKVISHYNENDAWEIHNEFLEALAHQCLLTPSAIRDTLTFIATNSLHQVRLAFDKKYQDRLDGDQTDPEKMTHLSRRKKEHRLAKLISVWPEATTFMKTLTTIDDDEYKKATFDYRNLNSHSIGPRLRVGITRTVVRSVRQAEEVVRREDGTYQLVPTPGKMTVGYGFGGVEPLDMEEARIANTAQYRRAKDCFLQYRSILNLAMSNMPAI